MSSDGTGGDERTAVPRDLVEALRQLASRRPLLLAFDFDGALAPIVPRPQDARPLPGSIEAIEQLSQVRGVVTALVSGRSRGDLATLSGARPSPHLLLVGSHGAEVDEDGPTGLDEDARQRLADVTALLEHVARQHPGARLEHKPASVVLHTRRMRDRASAVEATRSALQLLAGRAGVQVTPGKEVVEAAVVETGKGAALQRLRTSHAAEGVLYVGDDVTDEHAFAVLAPDDVGVKVGDGDTLARFRVADPVGVRDLLQTLVSLVTASAG